MTASAIEAVPDAEVATLIAQIDAGATVWFVPHGTDWPDSARAAPLSEFVAAALRELARRRAAEQVA